MKALVYMFIMYIFILQQKVFKVDGFVSRRISLWNASCWVIFMVKFTSKKLPLMIYQEYAQTPHRNLGSLKQIS